MTQNNLQKAVKALISSSGKYLLLFKSEKEDVSPSEWDIPGGRIKPGESTAEALAREVMEETGIDISGAKISLIKTWDIDKGEFKLSGTDFLCVLDRLPKINLSSEHISARWLTKEDIINDNKIPSWLKESVKKVSSIDF